ncbi:MAG: glycosyl hydrolase family 18 protein [Ginsengibacter sp.]
MFKKICYFIIITNCCLLKLFGQASTENQSFRIVGYYSLKAAMQNDFTSGPFDKLTHINLYFLNPDSAGNFSQDFSSLTPFINEAHKHHVQVLPSMAGGSPHPYYHELLKAGKRSKLVSDLLQIVLQYNFDGIDVDIEGSDIDENYENFAIDLKKVFHAHNKLVTSAIAVFYKDVLSDNALAQYDFVNIMSYDHTGPWTPKKPGPHSTYEQAVEDLNYFAVIRKIPKEKMNLGVPFYGYGFGPQLSSTPSSLSYSDIIIQFPNASSSDSLLMPTGATMYYNGVETIKKKTALAMKKASGVMIWQLSGDALGDKSLLDAIHQEINTSKK